MTPYGPPLFKRNVCRFLSTIAAVMTRGPFCKHRLVPNSNIIINPSLFNRICLLHIGKLFHSWCHPKWFKLEGNWALEPWSLGALEPAGLSLNKFQSCFFYYSADGKYEVTLMTKARLNYTGEIEWKPPAIYKSSCKINVEWFPFDEQSCDMKFGSWTYDGYQVSVII